MKVVLFLLDAFRHDYISETTTPFLWDCTKKGKYIKHIIPSAGFCERTEIFTGLKPNESGFFTAVGFDPENSQYINNYALSILGKIENLTKVLDNKTVKFSIIFRKIVLKVLEKKLLKVRLKPYNIPFSFLKNFDLTEDQVEFKTRVFPNNISLLKRVELLNATTFFDAFTSLCMPSNGTDLDRINIAISAAKDKDYLFTPIYIGVLDAEGHRLGPESEKLKIQLNNLDAILKNSADQFWEIDKTIKLVFLGDHGMTQIRLNLDIESILLKEAKSLKLKRGKDYIYFLDSTLLRVWFLTENARIGLEPAIKNNEVFLLNGELITDKIAELYDIPFDDRRYGDIAWWANEGILIFPDFFHNDNPYKGMHGYKPIFKSTHGCCISIGKNIKSSYVESMKLHEVFKLITTLIDN